MSNEQATIEDVATFDDCRLMDLENRGYPSIQELSICGEITLEQTL
jgi:hypothetical protein